MISMLKLVFVLCNFRKCMGENLFCHLFYELHPYKGETCEGTECGIIDNCNYWMVFGNEGWHFLL